MSRFKEAHCSECKNVMQLDTTEKLPHSGMCGPCHYDHMDTQDRLEAFAEALHDSKRYQMDIKGGPRL